MFGIQKYIEKNNRGKNVYWNCCKTKYVKGLIGRVKYKSNFPL